MDISGFDWGWMDEPSNQTVIKKKGSHIPLGEYHKNSILEEIFNEKIYEKEFQVEEDETEKLIKKAKL